MECVVTEREVMITGGLAFVFIFLSLWMGQHEIKRDDLPDGFKKPVLALELVRDREGVGKILGPQGSAYRQAMRENIQKDFVYIFGYGLFYIALSLLLSQVNHPAARWLGLAAGVCAAGAAIFDFVEDWRILKVLALSLDDTTNAMASSIRHASLIKWALLFIMVGLLALILLWQWNFFSWVALLFALGALVGLAGLGYHQLLTLAVFLVGFGVIGMAFSLTLLPDKFLQQLCY